VLVNTGDIDLAVHQAGSGPPVILVHGFPELAFSWRHQLPTLAAAGYRAIAPDMRGYGGSGKPVRVTDYTIQKLVGDLTGLLDSLEIEKAVIVGHDWGALVTWQMALLAAERMAGLVALNIPFFKRPPINPITFMRYKLGKDFYIVNFQKSDEADRRFAEDPGRFIDVMMRKRRINKNGMNKKRGKRRPLSLLEMIDREEPGGEVLLTNEELKYYADAFATGGFTGPINWYRNWTHNWKSTKNVDQTVHVPSLFIGASDDAIIATRQIEAMKPHVPDLEIQMIDDCGHWTQQEKPQELNEILLDWLDRKYPADTQARSAAIGVRADKIL
jgi:pimeloyl-ACP methyl ester carboxylesterase